MYGKAKIISDKGVRTAKALEIQEKSLFKKLKKARKEQNLRKIIEIHFHLIETKKGKQRTLNKYCVAA